HDADANTRAEPVTYTTFRYENHSSLAGSRRIIRLTAAVMLVVVPGARIIQFLPPAGSCSATMRPPSGSMMVTALCSTWVRDGPANATPDCTATIPAWADLSASAAI